MCICLFQFKFLSDYTYAIFKARSLAQLTVELEEWMFGVNESKCRMLTTSLGGARSIVIHTVPLNICRNTDP